MYSCGLDADPPLTLTLTLTLALSLPSTQINWNFVYPPAYADPDSGEKQLEAWCRTPLCLLVRPDEGNFESKLRGISESDRQALLHDPHPNPNLNPRPNPNPNPNPHPHPHPSPGAAAGP